MKKLLIALLLLGVVAPAVTGLITGVAGCRAEVGDPD